MKRPMMTAFWMEVALKVSEVDPSVPTVMKPSLAEPSSDSKSSSSTADALQARKATATTVYSHFMVMVLVVLGGYRAGCVCLKKERGEKIERAVGEREMKKRERECRLSHL